MKILHVISSLDPAQGGPPIVATRLGAAQAKLGHAVHIACYHEEGIEEHLHGMLDGLPHGELLQIDTLPTGGRLESITARGAGRAIAEAAESCQVLHLHGVWDPIVLAAARAAQRCNVPYAVAPHGMLDPWCLQQKPLKKRLALAVAHRRMLNGAAFLHLLNADEQDLIEPLRLTAPKYVLPNGVFLEELEPLPQPGSFYARHPELEGHPYVLFLSRLHHKKGLDYLADSFAIVAARHPSAHLVVVGPDEGALDGFQQQVQAAGITDRVHVLGPVYGPAKLEALVDAACFCLPSRQEGFSMAITEALACGVPVVISRACHFPEVEEAGAGSVVDLNPTAVAEAVLGLLEDSSRHEAARRAARELVRGQYTWPAIAERCVQHYLASGADPPASRS